MPITTKHKHNLYKIKKTPSLFLQGSHSPHNTQRANKLVLSACWSQIQPLGHMDPFPSDPSVCGTENFDGNVCLHGALHCILVKRQRDSPVLEELPIIMLRRLTGWGATHPAPFGSHPPQQMLPTQHAQHTIRHLLMSDGASWRQRLAGQPRAEDTQEKLGPAQPN